ncbi:MAG: hypothetical protein R3Y54_10575 [Eubacteriales bacterium]
MLNLLLNTIGNDKIDFAEMMQGHNPNDFLALRKAKQFRSELTRINQQIDNMIQENKIKLLENDVEMINKICKMVGEKYSAVSDCTELGECIKADFNMLSKLSILLSNDIDINDQWLSGFIYNYLCNQLPRGIMIPQTKNAGKMFQELIVESCIDT